MRIETTTKDAEGANLEQANPDESLRQKDPASESTLENPARDTDGVTPAGRVALSVRCEKRIETTRANLSGPITEAHDIFRAPF